MLSIQNTLLRFCQISLLFLFVTACSNSKDDLSVSSSPDTYENINRKVFSFNGGVDHLFLKPIAQAYKLVTPNFVDKGIGNFFDNLDDVGNAINNTLQGKFADAGNDTERFVFNSIFGFVGLVDIASAAGLEKHDEDFGQTLAKWGVDSGPYVMLPFLGPSTVRDAGAKFSIDRLTDLGNYSSEKTSLFVIDTVNKRSDLFSEEEVFRGLSDDKYSALRDVWLQNRMFLIRDGEVDESAESDLIDELESLDSE